MCFFHACAPQWNSSTTYSFEIERDFGTDYGICCWYTPQLNFTQIYHHMVEHGLQEPEWGPFFTGIAKVMMGWGWGGAERGSGSKEPDTGMAD